MKLIIDIPEEVYKTGMLGLYFDCYSMKLHDTILNGTPIPDNATNHDAMMKYAYSYGKKDVLEQIRDEIERLHHHPKLDFIKNDDVVEMALEVIDRHRESEVRNDIK